MLVPGYSTCLETSGESFSLQSSYYVKQEYWPFRDAEEVEQYRPGYYLVQGMQLA